MRLLLLSLRTIRKRLIVSLISLVKVPVSFVISVLVSVLLLLALVKLLDPLPVLSFASLHLTLRITLILINMDYEKIQKIWKVVKQIIEIILAALAGAAVGSCHAAVRFVAQLIG